jgi:hypothetical protein
VLRKSLAVLLTVALMAVMALLVVAPAFASAPPAAQVGRAKGSRKLSITALRISPNRVRTA